MEPPLRYPAALLRGSSLGVAGFLFKIDFPKFCPKFGKIPKFCPFSSKVGKICENLGKSWEGEKRQEEEISGNYSLVYFQYQQRYIFENCFDIYDL